MSLSGESPVDFLPRTTVYALAAGLEALLALGLMLRSVCHLIAFNHREGAGAGNDAFHVGIEPHFAVEDAGLSTSEELSCRALSVVVAAGLLLFWGADLGTSTIGLAYVGANWLVLVVDPAMAFVSDR